MMKRKMFLLAITFLLPTACAGNGSTISNDVSFDGNSKNAFIIVGMRDVDTRDRFRKPQLNIRRFDSDSLVASSYLKRVYVPTGPAALGVDFDVEDRRPFYVFETPPGHYLIESFYRFFLSKMTTFQRTVDSVTTVLDVGHQHSKPNPASLATWVR